MVKGDKMSKEAIKISTLIGAGSVCDGDLNVPEAHASTERSMAMLRSTAYLF